jgi:hypothetical protein
MFEATCTKCGETFNPNYFDDAGRLDLEHYAREDGTECGGAGRLLGAWGADAATVNEVETVNEARRLCDFPGCDEPANTFAQAQGASTPTKEWFGCDRHRAVVTA